MKQAIKVIGIGDSGKESLPAPYLQWIYDSERLVGGERHLAFFPDYRGEKITMKGGLPSLLEKLQKEEKSTVILASGDPMFYGIGGYLAHKLPVEIYPHVSSIQLAFAKMGESWQDAYFASVHGRSMKGLAQRVNGRDKVVLLTDEENSPQAIARYLLSFEMVEYWAFVAENLGGAEERTGWYSLEEMLEVTFSPLNVVILKRVGPSPKWPSLGIPDEAFHQRKPDKGLITKKEIRVLSLAQLNLKRDSTVWDIGTCTGSMAIEAARIARDGQVFAIEKSDTDLENCRKNMRKFRADLTVVHGKAPAHLDEFPDPDAVFIGGSGGEMRDLLHICCTRLKPGGRIVLNAVAIESLHDALQAFKEEGFAAQITLAQISRSKPILDMNRFEGLNPVYIITAEKALGGTSL